MIRGERLPGKLPLWRRVPKRPLPRAALLLVAVAVVAAPAYVLTRPHQRFATANYVNRAAGYRFLYPPQWTLTSQGTVAKLVAPGKRVIMTFGRGAAGGVVGASFSLVVTIRQAYEGVRVRSTRDSFVGGRRAYYISGSARTPSGTALRWITVTIAGERGNYSIVVFLSSEIDPEEVLPRAQEVVSSFREIPLAAPTATRT